MAFSRRFLACRTLGVPSEHGPLLSHLSVNKESRSTHSQEGARQGGRVHLPQEARGASLESSLMRAQVANWHPQKPSVPPSSDSPALCAGLHNLTHAAGQLLGLDHWEPPGR